MRKHIVITSIFPPTEAVGAFSRMSDCRLVVVGDRKTPLDWHCENVTFLSIGKQGSMGTRLHEVLPYDHYSRKMFGYLHAIRENATCIIDTDDDNIPKEHWGFPSFDGTYDFIPGGKGFINIYQSYCDQKIWPRGLPLSLVNRQFNLDNEIVSRRCEVGIWQGLADENPDVDAVYRLTSDAPCVFRDRAPLVLGQDTVSPFNTQNTMVRKELFPLLYLPTFVTFRFTDILRGLVAQPIMWRSGYHVGFIGATVVQRRNFHDYFKDFISEIPMYQHCARVVDLVGGAIRANCSVTDNLAIAYEALHKAGIVEERELRVLDAWLQDIRESSP